MAKHEVIIPGKAHAIAINKMVHSQVSDETQRLVHAGERRNKGRGYRVFTKLSEKQACELGDFFQNYMAENTVGIAEGQALRTVIARLDEVCGDSPQREEARAVARMKALEKGRTKRLAKLRASKDAEIWNHMKLRIKNSNCKCGLKKGMDHDDLRTLGAGCTNPNDYYRKILGQEPPWAGMNYAEMLEAGYAHTSGYVCPTLDAYRRYVENPTLLKDGLAED